MVNYFNVIICYYIEKEVNVTLFKYIIFYFNDLPIRVIDVATKKQEKPHYFYVQHGPNKQARLKLKSEMQRGGY